MVLNYIWIALFLVGLLVATVYVLTTGDTGMYTTILNGIFDSAKNGFEISLGLTGIMTLWLGLMKVGEQAGVINTFSNIVSPFFTKIFKGVPRKDKAYGSIMMNFSANMLGLDNAATPLGLKAMSELQELNEEKHRASDAQIMFLVLNTAGITLIPTSVIAIRQTIAIEQNVANFNAADIFLPTLIGTFVSFIAGLIAVAAYQKINLFKGPILAFIAGFVGLIIGLYFYAQSVSPEQFSKVAGFIGAFFILLVIGLFFVASLLKKRNTYDDFIEGAKQGFQVAVQIIPFLIAMLVAISVFRNAGCMDFVINGLSRGISALGINTAFMPALPVGLMKTLSGSGARGLMVDVMNTYGVESFPAKIAAIIQGSTETTFYVLAVYFGSVGIKDTRYAVVCGLIADVVGIIGAIAVGYLFFYH